MALDLNTSPPDEVEVLPDLNDQPVDGEDLFQTHAHRDDCGGQIAGSQQERIMGGNVLMAWPL